jgi:ADP-ribose pyrophosphatase YjhB (NUDIX family)
MSEPRWLEWARKLQSIAQIGLEYAKDPFDRERYEQIRRLSVEIAHEHTGADPARITDLFASESGYQTPKMDVRVAIVRGDTILLVHEKSDARWSLPGGWVDIDTSLREAAAKEVREEVGVEAVPEKLIAMLHRRNQGLELYPHAIITAYVGCTIVGDVEFRANTETAAAAFFPVHDLPPLSGIRTNRDLILMCYRSLTEEWPQTVFD